MLASKDPSAPATVEEFHDRLAALTEGLPKRLRQCAEFVAARALIPGRTLLQSAELLARAGTAAPACPATNRFLTALSFWGP